MFSTEEEKKGMRKDTAIQDPLGRIYPFSKDAICTLPKCGGNDLLRPSLQQKKKTNSY